MIFFKILVAVLLAIIAGFIATGVIQLVEPNQIGVAGIYVVAGFFAGIVATVIGCWEND